MSEGVPDLTAILDNLYIGNLASAKTLHEYPELGITHVLSVCPDYPEAAVTREGVTAVQGASSPTILHPAHRCVPIEDSEYEDILAHLPSAVAFIQNALDPTQASVHEKLDGQPTEDVKRDGQQGTEVRERAAGAASGPKNKVLVHCVMGISRSSAVVCAYLMVTRQLSFPAALTFIRKRRPRVHPNYGFRRQLQLFGECNHFVDYPAPVRSHPVYTSWQRKKKREIARYLARLDDLIEVKLEDEKEARLSFTDDFPTDPLEASSLLSEVGATHFLTVSPTSLPSTSRPALPIRRANRSPGLTSPPSSFTWSSSTSSDSGAPSPLSSRSSSFSYTSRLSSPVSGMSTPATSVLSLPSLLPPSKLRLEASSSESDSEDEFLGEPDYLEVAGVEYCHIGVSDSDLLFRLNEAVSFIELSLMDDEPNQDLPTDYKNFGRRQHVLIHSTTESKACEVVCAYLMSCKGMAPPQAYEVIEKAQPLFNPTKTFVTQLELYHDCDFNPTPDHPRVHAWLTGVFKSVLMTTCSPSSSSGPLSTPKPGRPHGNSHWKVESDTEGETDSTSLQRKLGTPMRRGSFSNSTSNPGEKGRSSGQAGTSSSAGAVDVEALLQSCAGVGDPGFAFDVEAFRGTLRGIAAGADKKNGRGSS